MKLSNKENIENGMMEWRDESNGIKDDGRIVKNWEIRLLGNQVMMRDWLKKREQILNVNREIGFKISMEGITREN